MGHSIALVLLSACAVIALVQGRPDDREYKIPDVGNGRRSQYSILHGDGTYKYGYDTGDGAFESARLSSVGGDVAGGFGYKDPDGNDIRLTYTAGSGGFVARGDHIPQIPDDVMQALANVDFVDPLASSNADASYQFRFDSDDHSRDEKSESDGTITGSFSYVGEDGIRRSYRYRAGEGIGFEIDGDDLPQPVPVPVVSPTSHTTRRRPVTQTQTFAQRNQVLQRPAFTRPTPPAAPTFPRKPTPLRSASSDSSGATYEFSYQTDDQSRFESSDGDNNVEGQFSFTADDGVRRTVDYNAGSGVGFSARGDHLPVAPQANFGQRTTSSRRTQTSQGTRTQYSGQRRANQRVNSQTHSAYRPSVVRSQPAPVFKQAHAQPAYRPSTVQQPTRQFEAANIRSTSDPISGTYSFNYQTSSHSRAEEGDSDNNVDGDFEFDSDDGERLRIVYEAGSDTGFIAEGRHIPIGPKVPGAPSGQPTGRIVPVQTLRFEDPLADSDTDASYKFEFEGDSYSRSESADEDGNVEGEIVIVGTDGIYRKIPYIATKESGFVLDEDAYFEALVAAAPPPRSSSTTSSSSFVSRRPTSTSTNKYSTGSSFVSRTPTARIPPPTLTANRGVTQYQSSGTRPTSSGSSSSYRGTSSGSVSRPSPLKSPFTPTRTQEVFPGFTLHQYDGKQSNKFGYVLKFD